MMCYGVMTVIMCLLFISTRVPLFSVETPPHWFLQSCLDTWFSQLHIIFHAFAWLSLARTGLRETLLALGKNDANGNRQAIERQVDPCQDKHVSVRQLCTKSSHCFGMFWISGCPT